MKKRYILLILFCLGCLYLLWCNISIIYTRQAKKTTIPLVADTRYPTDSFNVSNNTVFWQGFYHDWNYNHRVNRMGDWIDDIQSQNNVIRALFNHSAASGSGSDKLDYQTFFSYLKSNTLRFFSSKISTIVRGREATTTTKRISIKGVWPEELKNFHHGIVVLNGFDLFCRSSSDGKIKGTGNADKLSQFFINVDDLKIEGNQFEFDLDLKLGADCDSPECLNFTPGDNEWFDYQFTIAYQIIAYNENVKNTVANLHQKYTWRKPFKTRPYADPNEIFRNNKLLSNQKIQGNTGYNVGIPLINKIDITLPKGKGGFFRKRMETPHLLDLDIAIPDYTYNPSNGVCLYNADLFFKNWKTNMPALSYGNDGAAIINLGINLLQVKDAGAIVDNQMIKGSINWETSELDQRDANEPNAIKSFVYQR